MKERDIKVEVLGEPDLTKLSEEEQKTFYIILLTRVLELRKQQLQKEKED